ncbi:hypothetical protein [Lentzea sp. NPDC059081]|uniref:hypothetical protein n=1 Tax=Lentzea sp. NPDC059081 TaxID=3346719 RepID=UPI0036A81C5C
MTTTLDRTAFVQRLDIGTIHPKLALARAADGVAPRGAAAAVAAGSLLSFTTNVGAQHRADALHSTLLAQLSSDRLFDRFDEDQRTGWHHHYAAVLAALGWDVREFAFHRRQIDDEPTRSTVDRLLGAVLPAGEQALSSAALRALAALPADDPWYQVWDALGRDRATAAFQVGSCAGFGAVLVLQLSCFSLRTNGNTARFPWDDCGGSLTHATQACTLDDEVYSQVRGAVAKKLGAKAVQYVGNLRL